MKKFVLWLIKVFKIDIVTEKYITKEVTKYRDRYQLENEIFGDVYIDGNLVVNGNITVTGEITCYKIK